MDVVRVQLHAQEATSRGLPVPGRRRRGPLASGRLERPRGGKHARLGHICPPSLISAPEVCPSAGTSLRLEQTPGEGAPSSRGSVPPASCACWMLSPGDLGSSLWGPRRFCAGLRPHGSMMGNHGLTNPGLAGAMLTVRMAKATAAAEAAGKGTAKPRVPALRRGALSSRGRPGDRPVWQPTRRSHGCCVGRKGANSPRCRRLPPKALLIAPQGRTSPQLWLTARVLLHVPELLGMLTSSRLGVPQSTLGDPASRVNTSLEHSVQGPALNV